MADLTKNLFDVFLQGLQDWGSLHPVVVHFPIVLLFVAPFFILAAHLYQKSKKLLYITAFVLMLLGSASIFLATSTGDSAAEPLEAQNPAMVSALDAHVTLAEQTRLSFSLLTTAFFLFIVFRPKLTARFSPKTEICVICLYLIIYCLNLIILFNAAHYGGELVHRHGIRSALYSSQNH